jgi:hypothetical protein
MLSVGELRETLLETAPQAADALEVAALSESLGLTDLGALRLGYEDVFAFADTVFLSDYKDQFRQIEKVEEERAAERWGRELKCAGAKISNGLAYSLPWMLLTAAETFFPKAFEIPPALGSALSLSIIASLITTGGFAQAITRDVTFFLALGEPDLARQSVRRLMRYGFSVALLFAACGAFLCFYFELFPTRYVIIASTHYLLFCVLWMLCAILSAQGLSLLLPVVLLGAAGLIVGARLFWHTSALVLLLVWPVLAAVGALLCAIGSDHMARRRHRNKSRSVSPNDSIHSYMLLPIIFYGASYFSFLFADRLCAGSAVSWSSGLPFGVDPVYKHAMDLSLLAFLLGTVAVEYLSDLFVRFWWSRVSAAHQTATSSLSEILRRWYLLGAAAVATIFTLIFLCASCYLPGPMGLHPSRALSETLWFGGAGYLILSVTLFGSVILLSADAALEVSKAAGLGLSANLLVGYTMSHAVAMQCAALGLLAGSCVFAWQIHKTLWNVLAHPDYYYSLV